MASRIDRALRRSKRKLDRIPRNIQGVAMGVLRQNAEEANNAQRARVNPAGDTTGALRASIRNRDIPGRLAVAILAGGPTTTRPVRTGQSATYDYAFSEEFGTEDKSADPFFYGPIRIRKRKFTSRLTRAVKKEVRGAVR